MKKLRKYIFIIVGSILLVAESCKKDDQVIQVIDNDRPEQDVFTNGTVIKYIDNGDADNRINMVFIGDGFALKDQQKWKDHVDDMLDNLFETSLGEPFGRYYKFFNVYRIDMISEYTGLDLINRYTPLRGMSSCRDYTVGDCITDWQRTHDAIDYYMTDYEGPEIHFREVALNSNEHFGSVHYPQRGILNTYSAGNSYTNNIFIHENGHIAGKLADEYVNDENAVYTGGEPSNVNITTVLNPLKWEDWIGYGQPYSFTSNSLIGAYEGAKYVGKGIYRPSEQCMMNRYTNPFCAVCREKIILELYREIRPVDSLHIDVSEVSLQLIDPDLFGVIWYVDDVQVASGILSLDLDTLGLEQGEHSLRVEVSDKILEYSNTGTYFDWVRRDAELLKQEITKDFNIE